jgi:hypothetical protein
LADHLEFCGPHLRIVEAPNDAKYLPQFQCHTHITSAVVTVHLVVGTDGAIQEARVVGSEVTPVDMEFCAADIAHAMASAVRYSKPLLVCETTIRLRIHGGT